MINICKEIENSFLLVSVAIDLTDCVFDVSEVARKTAGTSLSNALPVLAELINDSLWQH